MRMSKSRKITYVEKCVWENCNIGGMNSSENEKGWGNG